MTDRAAEIDEIAELVNRLAIRFGNPERFHLDKDEAVRRLRKLAQDARGDARRPTTTWKAKDARQTAADAARAAFAKRKSAR